MPKRKCSGPGESWPPGLSSAMAAGPADPPRSAAPGATDEPVERIAGLAGFGSPANLRQHFARATGVLPLSYRRTFRCLG